MRASLFSHLHLGDKVACCLAMHSLAEHLDATIKVRGCDAVRELVRGLGMHRLEWEEGPTAGGTNLCLADLFCFLEGARIPFFTSPSISVDFEAKKMDAAALPSFDGPKGDLTLFQFDSRSQNDNKKRLSRKESMNFLKSKAKFKAVGVGGLETRRDLPYDYELGDLRWIIGRMKSAGQFVGVDSGMSHIAGALGVPSDIYLMHKEEFDVRMVERFYGEFYPKTRCEHDFSGRAGRLPRLKIF